MKFRPAAEWTDGSEGVFLGLTAAQYHQASGVSQTMLKHMDPTPAHLQAYLREPGQPTAAMFIGSMVHRRILEPEARLDQIATKPDDLTFRTREGRAWRDEQLAAGRFVLTEKETDTLVCCVNSIRSHALCRSIFSSGIAEVSIFASFSYGGRVLRRGRLDWVPGGDALVDIKTTLNASPAAFAREMLERGYHAQAAYYLDLWNDSRETDADRKSFFVIVAVEKEPPCLVAAYTVHPDAIKRGRAQNIGRLARYIDCAASGDWPGYSPELEVLNLPPWAYKREELA